MQSTGRVALQALVRTCLCHWNCFGDELDWTKFKANHQGHYRSLYGFLVRLNQYDGAEEFWVTIKETGRKTESTSYEEQHKKEQEAGQYKVISAGLTSYRWRFIPFKFIYLFTFSGNTIWGWSQQISARPRETRPSTWGVTSLPCWTPARKGLSMRQRRSTNPTSNKANMGRHPEIFTYCSDILYNDVHKPFVLVVHSALVNGCYILEISHSIYLFLWLLAFGRPGMLSRNLWMQWFPRRANYAAWCGSWNPNSMTQRRLRTHPSLETKLVLSKHIAMQPETHFGQDASHSIAHLNSRVAAAFGPGASLPCERKLAGWMKPLTSATTFGAKVKLMASSLRSF